MQQDTILKLAIGFVIVAVVTVLAALVYNVATGDTDDIGPLVILLGLMATLAGALSVVLAKKR